MQRLTAYISGIVQKTGYRAQIVLLASAFDLMGYVQNLPDGRVKVVAEGEEPDLERFLHALKIKDALIDVQKIEARYSPATGEFIDFEKMVSRGETDQRLDKAAGLLKDLITVNKEVVKELKATREGLGGEIRATREELVGRIKATGDELKSEIRATREEVMGVREEVKGVRDDVRGIHESVKEISENVKGLHENVRGIRQDVLGLRDEVKGVRADIGSVHKEVRATGLMLAGKIDGVRQEMVGEIRGLRCELQGDLKERLVRMEADVLQMRTRIGM